MNWVVLIFCIIGALGSLALLTVDLGECWDQAESIKSKRKRGEKNV